MCEESEPGVSNPDQPVSGEQDFEAAAASLAAGGSLAESTDFAYEAESGLLPDAEDLAAADITLIPAADETESEPEAAAEDPNAEMRQALSRAPGDWYIVHSYSGYEKKVKANLENRIKSLDMEDFIFQIEVPEEEVTEIKNGQPKKVQRRIYPGYILIRMELTDGSWSAVRNTLGSPALSARTPGHRRCPSTTSSRSWFRRSPKRPPIRPVHPVVHRLSPRSTILSASRSPSWMVLLPPCRRRLMRSMLISRN